MSNKRKIVLFQTSDDNSQADNCDYQLQEEYNYYYDKVASRFRSLKIICVFILCTFILGSFVFFGELFTYENARYVLRDISQILEEDSTAQPQSITFDSDGDMDFAFFKSNLVVAGNSSVKIIGRSGKVKLTDKTQFISPTIETSDKYCIVYSLGAYNLSVYNSVTRVHDIRFDYPIFDVALSESGHIAVMTQSREYRCCVYLYDSDFRLLSRINKTDYPSSVAFQKNADEICVTTFGVSEGDYYTRVEVYGYSQTQPRFSYNCNVAIPYDTFTTTQGNTVLMGEKGAIYLDASGILLKEYIFNGNIANYHFELDTLTVLYSDTYQHVLSVEGAGLTRIAADVSDANYAFNFDGAAYVLKKDGLCGVGDLSETCFNIASVPHSVLYLDGYAYLCYVDRILPIKIK